MTAPAVTTSRSRRQFWILIAVFFLPLAIAFALYYGASGWRPPGSTNHGDLITPARPIPHGALTDIDGKALPATLLRGRWTLMYVGRGDCDPRCREALTLTRQTRIALNDDIDRVQRLFVASEPCCDRDYLRTQHTDLTIARADTDASRATLAAFPDATHLDALGRIYIVDPLGNLMMSYGADAPPKGLLEDLKKLLKLSHIG
jgi:cytochrome oxidase Cu insertion factor (SCO1/SenC/PrrC family)